MKYKRYRSHKIDLGHYENLEFGGVVEFDPEQDTLPDGVEIEDHLEQELDWLLAPAAQRAIDSEPYEESHIFEYYKTN